MFDKKATTAMPINELLAARWSGRAFDPDRAVSREDVIKLLEAARWAPSCFGEQPWRFLVWDRARDWQSWQRAFDSLVEGNQKWARSAPLLLLACADSVFSGNEKDNRWGQYDTGMASFSLVVQATELGLMVHQMGGFDDAKVRLDFSIPERFAPMAMIAIGYQLAANEIPADMQERELAPRSRRELGESFFAAAWGASLVE